MLVRQVLSLSSLFSQAKSGLGQTLSCKALSFIEIINLGKEENMGALLGVSNAKISLRKAFPFARVTARKKIAATSKLAGK